MSKKGKITKLRLANDEIEISAETPAIIKRDDYYEVLSNDGTVILQVLKEDVVVVFREE
jgi:hypothetical protein